MRKNVPDQFLALRKRAGFTLDELALRMGYKRASSIQRYESPGDFRGNYLSSAVVSKLIKALAGLGSPPITEQEILALGGPLFQRTEDRTVPVISYVQAGDWTSMIEAYTKGNGFTEIFADKRIGKNSFALEIKGNSMLPRFLEGDRVIIDPDVTPIPGDFVVAKEEYSGDTTFKQYRPRGFDENRKPIIELKALNDLWPSLILDEKNPGKIIGTMMEHHSYRP